MDLRSRGYEKVGQLVEKGVHIPSPLSLDIGAEVDVSRISAEGVTLFPGSRIYGAKTVISAGCSLGAESPVTLDDCRLGPRVELKGGYFKQSVFLEGANLGLGAHVREGCLLEEEASGAHCVGLKQTILLPFVTLGSLINFCDCLMAGGTSREDHSEVGSSYIHFNYTPDGDKAAPSLFGDVPHGVMLDRPPIFLGGQGGAVGPVRVGYGTVVAAGSILRHDILDEGKLVAVGSPPNFHKDHHPRAYKNIARIVRNNFVYLANLDALEQWYRRVRQPFLARQQMGVLIHEGALEMLALARTERTMRLVRMAEKVPVSTTAAREFRERAGEACAVFGDGTTGSDGEGFFTSFEPAAAAVAAGYVDTVRGLTAEQKERAVEWLQRIVDARRGQAAAILPSMALFDGPRGLRSLS